MEQNKQPIKKVMIVVSQGSLTGALPGLVMANGALMEGMQVGVFFTFFGLDAVNKKQMNKLKVAPVANPAMRLPVLDKPFPNILGVIPGMSWLATKMMVRTMDKLDIPGPSEFIDMIVAGGGKIYGCKMAMDMFNLSKDDLRDDIDSILTVGEFYAKAEEDTQIIFT